MTPDPERFVLSITGRKILKVEKKYFSSLQLGFCFFLPHLQQIPCPIPGFSLPGQNNLSTQVVTSWLNRAFQEEICLLVSFQPRTVEQGTQSVLCPGRRLHHLKATSHPRLCDLVQFPFSHDAVYVGNHLVSFPCLQNVYSGNQGFSHTHLPL